MQFYISVMFLGLPDDINEEKPSFLESKKTHYGPTDGPADQRTDRPSYRDARTHLKKVNILRNHGALTFLKKKVL